jgi:sulfhydrogenase subunit beta (sulfur reductase)
MALLTISCGVVTQLIEKLMQEARVVAPQQREGKDQWVFDEVREACSVSLAHSSTILPPKKYVFPPKEKLVHYELGDKPQFTPVADGEPLVIFGAHPCDIFGIGCLDRAFADNEVDPNYAARRAQIRIVGVDCEPDDYCFCGSMGTASVSEGFDLFLTPVGDSYVVEVATEAGAQMLEGLEAREATAAEIAAVKDHLARKLQTERRLHSDVQELPMHFARFAKSPVWAKWAEKCYSCGTCNLTCPTCFCFDVLDQMDLSLSSGDRQREWDGCMLEDFAKVGSGENFLEGREDRLRHRFFRKYSYLFTKFGRPYCCGCGRCVRQCLVNIDPVGIINDLLAAGEKEA